MNSSLLKEGLKFELLRIFKLWCIVIYLFNYLFIDCLFNDTDSCLASDEGLLVINELKYMQKEEFVT
jgi:hypothetical protein